jgi:hypothetical protein
MPKKPTPITKDTIAADKAMMVAKARGDFQSAVYDAYYGPNAQLGIAGQPEGPMLAELDKAKTRLQNIDQSVADFGRWAGKARTDIKGYNPKKK